MEGTEYSGSHWYNMGKNYKKSLMEGVINWGIVRNYNLGFMIINEPFHQMQITLFLQENM